MLKNGEKGHMGPKISEKVKNLMCSPDVIYTEKSEFWIFQDSWPNLGHQTLATGMTFPIPEKAHDSL